MIAFSCPRCGYAQQVGDALEGCKFPCLSCSQRLQVPPPPDAGARPPGAYPPRHSGPPGNKWFYQQNGVLGGPAPIMELRRLAREDQIRPGAMVWTEGMAAWQLAEKAMPRFFDKVAAREADDAEDEPDHADSIARKWEGYGTAFFLVAAGVAILAVAFWLVPKIVSQHRSAVTEGSATEASSSSANSAEIDDHQLYLKILHSCVWIIASDGKKVENSSGQLVTNVWTGSGALVDRDQRLIITNEHVANESCVVLLVMFPEFRSDNEPIAESRYYKEQIETKALPAKVVATDRTRDLAVIRVDEGAKLPAAAASLRLANQSPVPPRKFRCIGGNPKGNDQAMWISTPGEVRQVYLCSWRTRQAEHKAMIVASNAGINPGDSGGPVYDSRGELIGVNSCYDEGANQIAMHIDVSEVRKLLPEAYRTIGKPLPDWLRGP